MRRPLTPSPAPDMHARSPSEQDALATGSGNLPKVVLAASDGARFEAYLHGAHVTSWRPAGFGDERLFLSPLSRFAAGAAIRGGVPVCFPQFADLGPLPMHGFARNSAWDLVAAARAADGAANARFRLVDSPATRATWPHAFACELAVTAKGPTLAIELAVTNTGADSFSFTTALHTYLRMDDVQAVRVRGLANTRYRDKVKKLDDVVENSAELAVDRPLDRVYHAVPADLLAVEPRRALSIRAIGTTDTVVWNPGTGTAATDLAPDAWRSFLCIEAAVAGTKITLPPSQTWRGSQTLTAVDKSKAP